ncbi:hypothetical protein [Streptacidiphilus neutrinimicus]|uniref:hypothetical protein n=1 Tax=Streptacidiphilus neutrinimicus TaxID=105420 RepID=UPI0005AA76B0|nr:hypothetical protein [Streptacidiphilus neutrinimicus]
MAVALRDAVVRRNGESPAVRSVGVVQVRWPGGGEEHLMVHGAVDEDPPSASADRLLRVSLREEVPLAQRYPKAGMLP